MRTPLDPSDRDGDAGSAAAEPADPSTELEAEVVSALQAALAADHAAIWVYGLLIARMPAEDRTDLDAALTAHRASRDATERLLARNGIDPVPAEPAYQLPEPLTDPAAEFRLAVTTEDDSAAAWYAVLAFSDEGDPVRRTAQTALSAAAVRAARWRARAGTGPVTVAFPGRPAG